MYSSFRTFLTLESWRVFNAAFADKQNFCAISTLVYTCTSLSAPKIRAILSLVTCKKPQRCWSPKDLIATIKYNKHKNKENLWCVTPLYKTNRHVSLVIPEQGRGGSSCFWTVILSFEGVPSSSLQYTSSCITHFSQHHRTSDTD